MISNSDAQFLGPKNYLLSPGIETGRQGWSLFNTTLTSKIPTGAITAGAASITTFGSSSTTPLSGDYSLRVASSGAVTAGHGFISDSFTVDRQDKARAMGWSFSFEAVSGTMDFSGTSANTWAVYIYDVDGAAWIQPAGVYNLVQSSGVGIASGTFQTTATGTQYRIAVICITATGGAVEMRFDSFSVGPQKVLAGAAISDWVSSTPTYSNAGTTSSSVHSTRRVGDTLQIQGRTVFATAGAAAVLRLRIPSSIGTIDTTKVQTGNLAGTVGSYFAQIGGSIFNGNVTLTTTANEVSFIPDGAGGSHLGSAFGLNTELTYTLSVPISGWSSNTVLSQDTDTRVVAARMIRGTTQALVTGDNKILLSSATFDTHAAFDAVNSRYIAPVSGYYEISASIEAQGSATADLGFGYRLNGSGPGTTIYCGSDAAAPATPSTFINGNDSVFLNAGSYIEFYQYISSATGTLGTRSKISVKRLSGPATIAASESVVAHYRRSLSDGNQTLSSASSVVYFTGYYPSKVIDTHNFVTSSASDTYATIPVSGVYEIVLMNRVDASTVTETFQHFIMLGGTNQTGTLTIDGTQLAAAITPTDTTGRTGTTVYSGRFNAGDIIRFKLLRYAAVTSVLIGSNFSGFTIKRVGN